MTRRDTDLLDTVVLAGLDGSRVGTPGATSTFSPDRRSSRKKRRKRSSTVTPGGANQESNRGYSSTSPNMPPMDCASPYGSDEDVIMLTDISSSLVASRPSPSPPGDDESHYPEGDFGTCDEEVDADAGNEIGDVDSSLENPQSTVQIVQEFLCHTSLSNEENDLNVLDGKKAASSNGAPHAGGDGHNSSVNEGNKTPLVDSGSDHRSVGTNVADDGKSRTIFPKHPSHLAASMEQKGYNKEELNDPEWCAENLKPGIELLYPVEEVMKMLPKLTPQEVGLVELYNIVANNCVNLKTFDAIVALIQREMSSGGFRKSVKMPTRKTFVENMKKKFPCAPPNVTRLDPSSVDHGIPSSSGVIGSQSSVKHDIVSVFYWHAKKSIIESLACPRMYGNTDNLIVNENDPFSKYTPHSSPNEDGTEVISGKVFQNTYDMVIKDPETEHLATYYMYLDKASSGDAQQRYNAEPVAVVCAYLKRLFRNMVKNWIMLGFIPDLELGSSAKKKKYRNTKSGQVSCDLDVSV
jgi:hypothetical protein